MVSGQWSVVSRILCCSFLRVQEFLRSTMSIEQPVQRNNPSVWVKIRRCSLLFMLLFTLAWASGCMESLFYQPSRGQTPAIAGPPGTRSVSFASEDETQLHGWLIPAYGDSSKTHEHPTVLHVHGNAGNILSHQWFTEHLPGAGINVFLFDFRGYGQSGGSAHRRAGLIADTHAALDTLLARDDIDSDRIGLYAQSLGGAIGILVMADRKELRAAVIESPFHDWQAIAANALGGEQPGPVARGLASLLIPSGPRPSDVIHRIKHPVLIVHGTADRIVPVQHSQVLHEAAGDRVELIEFKGGGHNTLRTTHPEYDAIMLNYFKQHLSPQ